MKLVTFLQAGDERLGLLHGDTVVDPLLASGDRELFGSALAFIRSGEQAIEAARAILADAPRRASSAVKDAVPTAPLRPSTILCSGSNYSDHNKEKANTPISGKEPEFFVKTADCVVGPGEPIVSGMVIITGTPAGTAWSADRELGGKGVTQPGLVPATRYCLPGDVVECEVEKIGVLRNTVAEAGAAAASSSARVAAG
jgi:2-keto-4-pentenoate hydratase/2-oxohepta-3-ene-1,7-dioic acid hydratase in catechol pathway